MIYVPLMLSPEDALAIIGICARERNLCHHTGSEARATLAYDLKELLKKSVIDAGHGGLLPKNPDMESTL